MKIGFFSLLGLLFIGLKLGAVIDWSWWWVLAPLWGQPVLAAALFAFALLIEAGQALAKKWKRS